MLYGGERLKELKGYTLRIDPSLYKQAARRHRLISRRGGNREDNWTALRFMVVSSTAGRNRGWNENSATTTCSIEWQCVRLVPNRDEERTVISWKKTELVWLFISLPSYVRSSISAKEENKSFPIQLPPSQIVHWQKDKISYIVCLG